MKKLFTILIIFAGNIGIFAQAALDKYLEEGLTNNPGLKADLKAYDAATESIEKAGSLPDPSVSVGYFVSPVETRVGPQQARIGVTQMLPWFGSLKSDKKIAQQEALTQWEEFQLSKNQYAYKVKQYWYDLYFLNRRINIIDRNLALLRSWENLALSKYESGIISMVDVIRLQLAIEELENERLVLTDEFIPKTRQFNLLINRDAAAEVVVPDSLAYPEITGFDDEGIEDHPGLRKLNEVQDLNRLKKDDVNNQNKPGFGVGVDYGIIGRRTDMDVTDNGRNVIMPMVTFSLPLYGKKYTADRSRYQQNIESTALRREELRNQLSAGMNIAINEYQSAGRTYQFYRDQLGDIRRAIRILLAEFTSAGSDFVEILRMQQNALEYELDMEKALIDRYKALSAIEMYINKEIN